jgi:RNA polymerase sigma-32 factor
LSEQIFPDDGRSPVGGVEKDNLPAPIDPLKMYLAELTRHPVLSKEDELATARRAYEDGDRDAAERLVLANLRLVVKIALEYYNTYLNVLDLVQEGNVGLLRAVTKYDPRKGTRFSTYASFWIRAYVLKHIMDSWSLVKVGTTQGQRRLFYNLNKEKRRLEACGIYPEARLLASSFKVKEEEINTMQLRLSHTDLSLNSPLHDGIDETLMDTLSSDEDVEETVSYSEETAILSKAIRKFKCTLDDRDSFIFDHRVVAEDPMSLQDLGQRFGISRERVRQVETKILKKFKRHVQDEGLRPRMSA